MSSSLGGGDVAAFVDSDDRLIFRAADGHKVTLIASVGHRISDVELTELRGGGAVVTWLDVISHTLQAHYAVFDRHGHLLANAATGNGYSTDIDAVALAGGGFLLADAESNLFGLHARMVIETFNARGQPTSGARSVVDETRADGGLWLTDLEGHYARGHVELTWRQDGESVALTVWPHAQGHAEPPHVSAAALGAPGGAAVLHDAWFT